MTMDSEPFSNRVREWRERRGLKLAQLANAINVTEGHMGNLERGRRELTKPVLERVARALSCEQADLLNLEDGGLTEQERRLIDTYREIPEAMRMIVNAVVEAQQPYRSVAPCDENSTPTS